MLAYSFTKVLGGNLWKWAPNRPFRCSDFILVLTSATWYTSENIHESREKWNTGRLTVPDSKSNLGTCTLCEGREWPRRRLGYRSSSQVVAWGGGETRHQTGFPQLLDLGFILSNFTIWKVSFLGQIENGPGDVFNGLALLSSIRIFIQMDLFQHLQIKRELK